MHAPSRQSNDALQSCDVLDGPHRFGVRHPATAFHLVRNINHQARAGLPAWPRVAGMDRRFGVEAAASLGPRITAPEYALPLDRDGRYCIYQPFD